jgi:hypothetical protein
MVGWIIIPYRLYGFLLCPSVSGFTVVRYAILNTFKVKVINSSLDIACEKGR